MMLVSLPITEHRQPSKDNHIEMLHMTSTSFVEIKVILTFGDPFPFFLMGGWGGRGHVTLLALMTIALLHCLHYGGIIALVIPPLPCFVNVISFSYVITAPFLLLY